MNTQKIIFTVMTLLATLAADAQTVRINISGAQFTRRLVERLATEYRKQNPSFKAEIVSTGTGTDGDASVSITADRTGTEGTIAHYVLLPITNPGNAILGEKKVQKGLDGKLTRELFVEKSLEEYVDTRDRKQLPGTVYSLSGSHATTTELLANSLNVGVREIKGKKVIGREENVISVVRKRPDAIAFDVASLVYDRDTRKPVSGVAVLPVDIDGNGKVTDEERGALSSLDALTAFIGNTSKTSLPTGSVKLSSRSKDADAFIIWAETAGQEFVGSEGYLKSDTQYIAWK